MSKSKWVLVGDDDDRQLEWCHIETDEVRYTQLGGPKALYQMSPNEIKKLSYQTNPPTQPGDPTRH